jgi:hypothetical protein
MNEADQWFDHSVYRLFAEIENVHDVRKQISAQYREAQRVELELVRAALDKIISEWQAKA